MAKRTTNISYFLLLLLVLTPLFVVSIFLYPFTAKIYLIRILISLFLGVGIWRGLIYPKKYNLFFNQKNYILWALIVFMSAWFICALVNHTLYISFWSTPDRGVGLLTWLYLTVFFIVASININRENEWHNIFITSIYTSIVTVFLAVLGYFGLYLGKSLYHLRLAGPLGNPLFLGTYLLINFFITAYLALEEYIQSNKINWLYIVIGLVQIVGIMGTGSRGVLLALISGIVALLVLLLLTTHNKLVKKWTTIILIFGTTFIIIFLCLGQMSFIKKNPILSRFVNFSFQNDASVQSRLINSQIAIEAFKQKPLFGWGPENYFEAFISNYNEKFQKADPGEIIFDRVHNAPVETLATGGILLFIPYVMIYLAIFWTIYKIWQTDRENNYPILCFAACFLAYFIASLFLFDTPTSLLILFIILAYLYYRYNLINKRFQENQTFVMPTNKVTLVAFYLAICLLVAFSYQINLRPFLSSNFIGLANYYLTQGKTDTALSYLQSAEKISPYLFRDGVRAGKLNITNYKLEGNNTTPNKIILELIRIANKTLPYWHNTGGLFDYYKANLYTKLKNPTKEQLATAENILVILVQKYPNYIPYRNGLVEIYAMEGKYQESIGEANIILSFTNYYPDPYWYKGVSLNALGESENAFINLYTAFTKGYPINKDNLNNLIQLAINLNKKQELPNLYLSAIELNPKDYQLYASLATAYQKIGDYDNARKTAQKMLELDPSFKSQVDAFLKTLPTN